MLNRKNHLVLISFLLKTFWSRSITISTPGPASDTFSGTIRAITDTPSHETYSTVRLRIPSQALTFAKMDFQRKSQQFIFFFDFGEKFELPDRDRQGNLCPTASTETAVKVDRSPALFPITTDHRKKPAFPGTSVTISPDNGCEDNRN